MDRGFERLVESQIRKAIAEGKLEGLEGEGKPLPRRGASADLGTEIAMRMMAEAGALPEEVKLKKLLDAARETWRSAATPEERRLAMAVIADLEWRYNTAREARRRLMR